MTRLKWLILAGILAFVAATRLFNMDNYPSAFGQDEIVVGYDAYCLLHTGHDHHGEFLPLLPRMFNDYLSGIQTYWTIPFVALLGPTEQAVRLACSLPNIIMILVLFLVVRRLFKNVEPALWAAFVVAIAPWHFFFSRWAVQPNFVPFFLLLFLFCFYKTMDCPKTGKGYVWSVCSGIAFVLLAQVYPAQMFFAPMLALVLGLMYLRNQFKRLLVMGCVVILGILPFVMARMHRPASLARFSKETILYSQDFASLFWTRYSEYLSMDYLYKPLQNQYWQQFPGTSYFPGFLMPFYVLGIFVLIVMLFLPTMNRKALEDWLPAPASLKFRSLNLSALRQSALFVLLWLVLAPVPAALFKQTEYTTRTIQLFPVISIAIALGLTVSSWLVCQINSHWVRWSLMLAFTVVTALHMKELIQSMRDDNDYFKETMQAGLQEVIEFLDQQPNVKEAHFEPLNQAYIYYLFYAHIDPHTLVTSEVSPPPPTKSEEWQYLKVPRVRNYYFNETIDPVRLQDHAVLRHQIKDQRRAWFDLYEDGAHRWYVVSSQVTGKLP